MGRAMHLIKVHIAIASEDACSILVIRESCPHAMPHLVFAELECDAGVILVPTMLLLLGFECLIRQCDKRTVADGAIEFDLAICSVEQRLQNGVHLQHFG